MALRPYSASEPLRYMSTLSDSSRTLQKPWLALLVVAMVMAIGFILVAALPYFLGDEEKLSRYDGRRTWLLVHIAFGIVPLLVGPVQIWQGFARPHGNLHRCLGMLYLCAIAISCVTAY